MRIRFFNTFEPVSPFYRDLIPSLVEQGHQIEILISSTEYRKGRELLEEILDFENVRIRRMPSGIKLANSSIKKIWVITTYIVTAAMATLFGRSADLNFFLTQPPLFQVWGRVLRRLRGQPFMCLVMDLYPDVAISAGSLKPNSFLAKCMKRISRSTLNRAKNVVVIGRCMRDFLEQEGVSADRIVLIRNWVNEHEIQRIELAENRLRKELGFGDKFVCLYSGNMGVSHRFDEWLEAICLLRDENIEFVFVGGGSRKSEIDQFCEQHQLAKAHMLPYQATQRLSESMGIGDIHFVCLRNDFVGKVVPSKAYGALAAGKPIIYQGDSKGEIAQMVRKFELGFVVEEGDAAGLVATIRKCHRDPNGLSQWSLNAYQASQNEFSRETALASYRQLFSD